MIDVKFLEASYHFIPSTRCCKLRMLLGKKKLVENESI